MMSVSKRLLWKHVKLVIIQVPYLEYVMLTIFSTFIGDLAVCLKKKYFEHFLKEEKWVAASFNYSLNIFT